MVLFEANTHQWRRWIGTRGVVFNVLRLCARRAYTVYELSEIKLRDAPGLARSVFDVLSDINVSVVVGEGERRELITVVGTVPDPTTSGGVTYLLRTTLLAFLLSPALALAEPDAYGRYLRAWAAHSQTRQRFFQHARARFPELPQSALDALYECVWRTSLVFPRYLSARWLVAQESPSLKGSHLDLAERTRVFGEFFLSDVSTLEGSSSSLRPLGKGIPQYAKDLLRWLSTSDRSLMERALRAEGTWAARRVLWELRYIERRARRVAHEPPLNVAGSAEDPPMEAVQPGRFGFCLV